MKIGIAQSSKQMLEDAVNDIKLQLSRPNLKLIIYFASSHYEPGELARLMQGAFGQTATIGNSTAGELISGDMLKHSIVAMALDDSIIEDAAIEVISDLTSGTQIKDAFKAFEKHYQNDINSLDLQKFVGLTMIDGLSGAEECMMEQIGALTNLTFLGGSAGDDLKFVATYVYANGIAYKNAAILTLIKTVNGFDMIKTQSFNTSSTALVVTKADIAKRLVVEFNGKPAAAEYARAVETNASDIAKSFMHNPLGLMIGEEPYVRSPQKVTSDGIYFYCNIKEGMTLRVLEGTDIIKDTEKALNDKITELKTIKGMLVFNCILRTLELESLNKTTEFGMLFKKIPAIGFSTYGEQYLGHINQTATVLLFK